MIKSNITNKTYLSPVEAFTDYCSYMQHCEECPFHNITADPCQVYVYENPEESTPLMDCEEVEPGFLDLETGDIYFSLLDVFNNYCGQHPDCQGCYFLSIQNEEIEEEEIEDDYDCYNYLSNHIDDCLPYLRYTRISLNG